MLKRTFHYEIVRSPLEFRVKNLLHLTVTNQGANEVKIFGATIQPGGSFNIPSDGIAFLEDLNVVISFEGEEDGGNNAYVVYTTLTKDKNC